MNDKRQLSEIDKIPVSNTVSMQIFTDETSDNYSINNISVTKSTFQRLGLKNARFNTGQITQSLFEDVYLRKAYFNDIIFTGTVFRNTNLDKATLTGCNFKYCQFYNTLLPVDDMIKCLPNEPNLKRDLARNLKSNFLSQGDKKSADIFLDIEINSDQDYMKEIFLRKSKYYKDNFNQIDQAGYLGKWCLSKLSGLIWGYGHRVSRLLISFSVIIAVLTLWFYISRPIIAVVENQNVYPNLIQSFKLVIGESIKYSFNDISPKNNASAIAIMITRFIGILYLGLLTATVYRKIAR